MLAISGFRQLNLSLVLLCRYSTTPNSGLLGPGQECDIIVTMLPLSQEQYIDFSSTMSCTDKFLVRSCFTDESVTEDNVRGETAASWWNSRPKSELTDQVITCSYIRQATRVEVGQSKLRFQKERSPHKMVGTSRVLAEEVGPSACLALFLARSCSM